MPSQQRTARRHNLPALLTSFVGRTRERTELRDLLATTRLVTLTGPGGSGKTRLALEAARDVLRMFPDGVWLTELASLSDGALVPRAVALAVGLRDESDRPIIDILVAHLVAKRLCIVIDNCEHVIDACAHLVDALLRACPSLHVLTTSREPLGIAGETIRRVTSLSFPDVASVAAPDELRHYEAPQLFVERAIAALSTFAVTPQNAASVAEVSRRLDGIPLAIELAAARVKGLTVEQISARLDDRFRLLTGGSRAALPRQQTLRATMDWSYQFLSEPERALLRRLSVFAGGFSLEAVQEVCADGARDPQSVMLLLLQLVDKSLVVADDRDDASRRYRLLETVRQYARERLLDAGESAETLRRHRDWYLALADRAESELRSSRQTAWLNRLALEHDNCRAALEWNKTDIRGADAALRIPANLLWFYFHRGHWTEARTWLETGLARASEASPDVVPKAMHAAAFLALRQGDLARARELAERGYELCCELGDDATRVWFLIWLGLLGFEHREGQKAEHLLEQAIALARELRDAWCGTLALAQLGILDRSRGRHQRAIALHTECLARAQETGDPAMIAYQLRNLGVDAVNRRDFASARQHFANALHLCREVDERWISTSCFEGLAAVASAGGSYQRAALLFGAGEQHRVLIGDVRSPVADTSYEEHLRATRSGLGEEVFAAALAEGHAMTFQEAIEYALELREQVGSDRLGAGTMAEHGSLARDHGPLSARECEVAILVAAGLSNREIATQLHISERTAQTHVQHILNKLRFRSRAQIASWTIRRGLTV